MKQNYNLSREQQNALVKMDTGKNIFLSGEAGTGKSAILTTFLQTSDKMIAVTAPTGIAAQNIGGDTVHGYFNLPTDTSNLEIILEHAKQRTYYDPAIDTLVIDEISMLRVEILEAIDKIMRYYACGDDKNKPFGGKQIIVVGDFHQLPPVITRPYLKMSLQRRYGGIYAFHAPSWKAAGFENIMLTEVHRQDDPELLDILYSIRHRQNVAYSLDRLNRYAGQRFDSRQSDMILCCRRKSVEFWNNIFMDKLSGQEVMIAAEKHGHWKTDECPIPELLWLKRGMRVMMASNKYENGQLVYANGDTGTITRYHHSELFTWVEVQLEKRGHVTVFPGTWVQKRRSLRKGINGRYVVEQQEKAYTQIPLLPGYAVTVHRAQGKTLSRVCIDKESGFFEHGQLYTALSRVRSLYDLNLKSAIETTDLIVDTEVIKFYDTILIRRAFHV